MKYLYSAVFRITPEKVHVRIPDLPGCITTGKDLDEAIDLITDAASLWLVSAEDHDDQIPAATPQEELPHEDQTVYSFIQIDTIQYRAETESKAVRKNVSLPAWMAAMADKRGINCSQVLQEGLHARLAAQ